MFPWLTIMAARLLARGSRVGGRWMVGLPAAQRSSDLCRWQACGQSRHLPNEPGPVRLGPGDGALRPPRLDFITRSSSTVASANLAGIANWIRGIAKLLRNRGHAVTVSTSRSAAAAFTSAAWGPRGEGSGGWQDRLGGGRCRSPAGGRCQDDGDIWGAPWAGTSHPSASILGPDWDELVVRWPVDVGPAEVEVAIDDLARCLAGQAAAWKCLGTLLGAGLEGR